MGREGVVEFLEFGFDDCMDVDLMVGLYLEAYQGVLRTVRRTLDW